MSIETSKAEKYYRFKIGLYAIFLFYGVLVAGSVNLVISAVEQQPEELKLECP